MPRKPQNPDPDKLKLAIQQREDLIKASDNEMKRQITLLDIQAAYRALRASDRHKRQLKRLRTQLATIESGGAGGSDE